MKQYNQKEIGVYQLGNGNWAYRFTQTIEGKRRNFKRTKDENGQPFKTQKSAVKARQIAIIKLEASKKEKPKQRMTMQEVYSEYCDTGRNGKAYSTIRKQESLWNNHLSVKFGNRFIDDISVAEINDYLSYLYYVEGRAYSYVESFLKMFYLIFGQAYSRNYLDVNTYNKLCINKDIKIHMPKRKIDDDNDIVVFSKHEILLLDDYFKGSNAETAYMLGKNCGLRINECYGLKWNNVDLEKGVITIDRQMQYQDGLIKLVPLKTRNARRMIYLSDKMKEHLFLLKQQKDEYDLFLKEQREQNQTFITDINCEKISSLELVNCLPNGKIQTVNSMKFHSRTIKEKLNIEFKYHYLRHTYGTRLAELNTPTHILCNQMGHASGKVTERYYLGVSMTGIDILTTNLNNL